MQKSTAWNFHGVPPGMRSYITCAIVRKEQRRLLSMKAAAAADMPVRLSVTQTGCSTK